MIYSCFLELMLTTKGDLLGNREILRFGLTQGTFLSPMLFSIFINYFTRFCQINIDENVQSNSINDLIIHAKEWAHLQTWLYAYII